MRLAYIHKTVTIVAWWSKAADLICVLPHGNHKEPFQLRAMQCGRAEDKIAALLWLVREAIEEGQPTLVFASTRHHVEFLHTLMTKEGIDAACVYGAMDQVRACL